MASLANFPLVLMKCSVSQAVDAVIVQSWRLLDGSPRFPLILRKSLAIEEGLYG